jgi:hypothetical protein
MIIRRESQSKTTTNRHRTRNNEPCLSHGPHRHICKFCGRVCIHDVEHCPATSSDYRVTCPECLSDRDVAILKLSKELEWL